MKKVIVIGGGASGLMAAYVAAKNGNETILLEKNEKLGKKIYITGKGRCNVTNACAPPEFLAAVNRGAKFLTGAIYSFPPERLMNFLESYSLKLKTERGNRVFPASDHASDVTKTFERALADAGADIRLNTTVLGVERRENFSVSTDKGVYEADAVIVCTGGLTYPATGSTGDGYRFAERFSHTVTPLRPALCGIGLKGGIAPSLQGLTLKNVTLTAEYGGKKREEFGEMLFTHFGISGPIVLTLSSFLTDCDFSRLKLFLDLKPALSEEQLDKRILRDFGECRNKQLSNALAGLLPVRMIDAVLAAGGLNGKKAVNAVTKEERERLKRTLKRFPLQPEGLRGFSEAIITAGGVSLKEINPKTMESKLCPGLYFCGEVLDADAKTGGYNLQIAFATGYAAGNAVK